MTPVSQAAASTEIARETRALPKAQVLIEALNQLGLEYCHWKSNMSLTEGLCGKTDLDLLIAHRDATLFRTVLGQHGFRPAVSRDGDSYPSMEHFYGVDESTGILVHVHAYYRVITGESLAKNYRFPLERLLLENSRWQGSLRVPMKPAELVVFTLRMMLKHTQLVELALLSRDWRKTSQEADWLLEPGVLEAAQELVREWLPALDVGLFSECVRALSVPASLPRRIWLGHRLRASAVRYARHSSIYAWLFGLAKFSKMAFRSLVHSKQRMFPAAGGAVIAFVGPEATGKTTLIKEVQHWLGEHFEVEHIHVGKPRSTLLTLLPNLLMPAFRKLLPELRSSKLEKRFDAVENREELPARGYPLIFALRAVMMAYDRRALLTRAFAQAANGKIILCDRYPSVTVGAPDSPQIDQERAAGDRYPLQSVLGRMEARLYRQIPPADLVISLTVPVEVAVIRNKNRGKEESEDYLRQRHASSGKLEFKNTVVHKIATDCPLTETLVELKKAIWEVL